MTGITIWAEFSHDRCIKYGCRHKRKMMLFKKNFGRIENLR